jgi:predicted TIM-barrel fold metal-dependent hydrolase
MVGMKMAGGDGVCSLAIYDSVFRYAGELKAGIYIHTWLKVGGDPVIPGGRDVPHESKPQDVATLATRHPEISFICGHTGGDWELGVRAVRRCRNVSVEIGGSYPTRGMVEFAVKELGAERIIYGSDVAGRSFASQLAKVYGAPISDTERQLIFGGNLQRMLAPIMKTKGIALEG